MWLKLELEDHLPFAMDAGTYTSCLEMVVRFEIFSLHGPTVCIHVSADRCKLFFMKALQRVRWRHRPSPYIRFEEAVRKLGQVVEAYLRSSVLWVNKNDDTEN